MRKILSRASPVPFSVLQREGQVALPHRGQPAQVDGSGGGAVVLLVRLGERVAVQLDQAGALVGAGRFEHGGGQVVVPGAGRLGQLVLELGGVDVVELAVLGRAHHEVKTCRERLADARREVDALTAESLLEDLRDLLADRRVVAVAREVDEAGQEAAVAVTAQEQPELAALARVHDRVGDRHQVVDRGLEELVARVGLQHVHQRLAGVAVRLVAGPLDHLLGLLAQHRDPVHGLGVRRGGEQAEDAALPHHVAGGVELLHADVVEVHGTVHGCPRVGLGQHQEVLLPGACLRRRGQLAERRRLHLVGAQDAEPGARHGTQELVVAVLDQVVLAEAEEREVVVGEPGQELASLGDLVVRQRRRVGLEVGDDRLDGGVHPPPVLDRFTDVQEHLEQGLPDVLGLVLGHAVDLDVHPRLAVDVVGVGGRRVVQHLAQLAVEAPAYDELGVHDLVDGVAGGVERHADGVDQERHVVGDHLDDRAASRRSSRRGPGSA